MYRPLATRLILWRRCRFVRLHLVRPGYFITMLQQRTLPPDPSSAMAARAFAREVLSAWHESDAAETVLLLVSELVANAVLHAGTKVEVCMLRRGHKLRVEVSDESPVLPATRNFETDATTGRGLGLVDALADSWGAEPRAEHGKVVWFEVTAVHPSELVDEAPLHDLAVVYPEDEVVIRLLGAPVQLFPATQQHTEALLREYALMAMQMESGQAAPRLVLDMSAVAAQLRAAVDSGLASADLVVAAPESARSAVADATVALEVADRLAEDGQLLNPPALPEVRWCREWFLGEVMSQLSGEAPTPWTMAAIRTDVSRSPEIDHRAVLDELHVPVVLADDQNHIAYVNAATETLLGWPTGGLVGQRLTALIPERLHEAHIAGYTRYQVTRQPRLLGRPVRVPALRHDGSEVDVEMVIDRLPDAGGRQMFVALLHPVIDLTRDDGRRWVQLVDHMVTVVSEVDGLTPIGMEALLAALAESMAWPVATWWSVDGDALHCSATWSVSPERYRTFEGACRMRRFSPGEGLPGRVWSDARTVWLDDVVRDANFPRMAVALQHDLRTAVALPIRAGGEIRGVVELFSDDIVVRDDDLMMTLDTVGRVLGFAAG